MDFKKNIIHSCSRWTGITLLLAGLFFTSDSFGQIQVYPIQRKAPASKKQSNAHGRIKAGNLTLPFWDDFSFTPVDDPNDTTSNFPLDSLWENSNSTWISSSLGINAPTLNVASLDGVDSLGRSYSDQILANGFRDKLVSRPINLGGNPSNVFLSFKYQWQGNGEAPDQNDFLQLEFLSKSTLPDGDTAWIPVITIYPTASMQADVFYDTIIAVQDNPDGTIKYLYDGFQFRFRSYGRESGPFDNWNIDYVYLNSGRSLLDLDPPDIAIASTLTPLFNPYYAVPIDIFLKSPAVDSVVFVLQSLQSVPESRNYSLKATISDYIGNTTDVNTVTLDNNLNIGQAVDPFQRYDIRTKNIPDTTSNTLFNPLADSIDITYTVNIEDGDETTPVNYAINDLITKTYHLNNYYAYDDGSAEYSGALTTPGNRVAVAFDIASDAIEKLAGIDIYLPPFSLNQTAVADFTIYDDNNGKPGAVIYDMPNRGVKQLGLNQFQRLIIPSTENVFVSKRFYVGWKAPTGGLLNVGLDYSNDTSDKVFVKLVSNGEWAAPANTIHASFMVRPLFGANVGVPTGIEEELAGVSLYPNPTKGDFFLEGRAEVVSIIDMKGQRVPFEITTVQEKKKISMTTSAPGIYLVRLQQGKATGVQKILIR
jgi:hypothetical protein